MTRLDSAKAAAAPDESGAAAAGPHQRRRRGRLSKRAELAVLLAPALALFILFVFVPMVIAAWYSLYNWSGYGPLTDFIGAQNYTDVLTGPVFHQAVLNNVLIAVLSLLIQLPISIGLALLLNRRFRGQTALRLAVFTPYVLSEATTAVIWLLLLQPNGFVNQLLQAVGLGSLIHQWLASTSLVIYTLFAVVTWKYIGFGIVLLLAGLQGIPAELHQAAAVDGATSWQITRRITLPLLGPTIRIWIFLSVIGSLQLFDIPWIMTNGGPATSSSTMIIYLFQNGILRVQLGFGAAVAVVLLAISFVFALLYQRFALRRDTAGALTRAVG